MTVYFDNSATTKVCREAIEAVVNAMGENFGNPSSTHKTGREARDLLILSRERVAKAMGADPGEIYFTSGGTEADNWAFNGSLHVNRHKGKHIITTATEHDAIINKAKDLMNKGYEVTFLKPEKSGRVTVESVLKALRPDTVLVSVMLVNNETGAVNPVSEISKAVKRQNPYTLIHTDAVQAFLKIPFTPKEIGADLVTVSSHKIHGPKGIGALYIKKGLHFTPDILGGGQESGLRSGTEAMPAIAGFGAAAEVGRLCFKESCAAISALREYTARGISENIPSAVFIGEGDSPSILCVSFPGYRSEVLLNFLDADGICVSKGSACKKGARSHVLEAMDLDSQIIDGAIRISFSRMNTKEEADYFIASLKRATERLKKR